MNGKKARSLRKQINGRTMMSPLPWKIDDNDVSKMYDADGQLIAENYTFFNVDDFEGICKVINKASTIVSKKWLARVRRAVDSMGIDPNKNPGYHDPLSRAERKYVRLNGGITNTPGTVRVSAIKKTNEGVKDE